MGSLMILSTLATDMGSGSDGCCEKHYQRSIALAYTNPTRVAEDFDEMDVDEVS